MGAHILSGLDAAREIKTKLGERIQALAQKAIQPSLAIVLVGHNEASQIYVRHKERACQALGIKVHLHHLPDTTTQPQLDALMGTLSSCPHVHGVLLQLPLPLGLCPQGALRHLAPQKDVDGLTTASAGALWVGKHQETHIPCTAQGVMHLIRMTGRPLAGASALVIGRSQLVGLPTAHLLLGENATVTMAHSHTKNLSELCQKSHIIVAACGVPELIQGSWIQPGATVIDVGIHRTAGGTLVGDVHAPSVRETAGFLSPVPGGVGPLTVAYLLFNTVRACEKQC